MAYPNLKGASIIALDIETYDPELLKQGPGVFRKDGNILGVSIATDTGFSEYYNLGHKGCSKALRDKNVEYLREVLALPTPKVGANILYDLVWLCHGKYEFTVNGTWHDVQIAEPLIDENQRSYSLDSLALKYLGKGKAKSQIQAFCDREGLKGDPRKWLWMMKWEDVREYAIVDAEEPIEILAKQKEKLESEGLTDLYAMESGLLPMLLQMRKVGVRIDQPKLKKYTAHISTLLEEKKKRLFSRYGSFNINSSKQVAKVMDRLGLEYPTTSKGNPSLGSKVLGSMNHEVASMILDVKKYDKSLNTFFVNSLSGHSVNGRIHAMFNPLKSDNYGTVSGRFSSSKPNLQQIPHVNGKIVEKFGGMADLGFMARDVFIPEDGHLWGKIDYSQIEYRFIAHYARGKGSDEIRQAYTDNPKTDYHQLVMDLTGFDRPTAKNINFGAAYSMGIKSCSELFGWTIDKSTEFLKLYHEMVPFVKYTSRQVVDRAKTRDMAFVNTSGFIRTILKRKARISDDMRKFGKEYSLFNRLIQGSAADQMKKAMHDSHAAGVFNVLVPHITVHDELDFSFKPDKEGIEAYRELKNIMETCIPLKVPVIADAEAGASWATVKDYDL